jgi:outer membrane PBP1 activator LpoA protein
MPHPTKLRSQLLATLLLPALLFSCANNAVQTPTVAESTSTAAEPEQIDPRYDQQLSAIEALIEQHQIDEAEIILNGIVFNDLSTAQRTRYVLAKGNMALIIGDGQEALRWFSGEYAFLFDGLPLDAQIEIGLKRAEAYEFSGSPLSAARERIFMAPVLEGVQADFNHEMIWFDLQLTTEDQLRALVESESSPDLTGWIELSLISRTDSEDLYRLLAGVEKWQKRNRTHPAARKLPGSLQMLRELAAAQPTHVGVLLPLSGPSPSLQKAANAIRDGLLTSWHQAKMNGQETPQLSFYDTAKTEDVQNLYKQAVTNGAEMIIGPLSKNRVQRLAEAESLEVPVLALNYMDSNIGAPDNFYQFGLAPEDEARQVADDIWQQGVRSVMVVARDSSWGIRVSDAFIRHWQLKGGTITSKALFNQPDQYLSAIKNALNIQHSERRHQLLQNALDESIEFEFRRRQDVDMVFMLAFPAEARQLKPVLNYQRATDIPVVATSHLFSGRKDPDKDKDLEGIRFVDMPWRLSNSSLRARVSRAFPESLNSYASLVALGIDAYRVYPRLPQMAAFDDVRVQGVTGALSMKDGSQLQRSLDWAIVENGLVRKRTFTPIMPELP